MRSRTLLFVLIAVALAVTVLLVVLLRDDAPPPELAPNTSKSTHDVVTDARDNRPDERLAVPVEGAGHERELAIEPTDAARAPGELPHEELHPGWMRPVLCVVDGSVRRPDGTLAGAGVIVRLGLVNQNGVEAEAKTSTDAEGLYRCERLEPWRLASAKVFEHGFAPGRATPNVWLSTEHTVHLDLTLARAENVDVLVIDRLTRKPISNVAVRSGGALESDEGRQTGILTGADGHALLMTVPVVDTFTEGGVEQALFEFTLASDSWLLRTPKVSAPKPVEGKPYELRLEIVTALARIQGEVVRLPANTPCPKATIYLCRGNEFTASIADDRGQFVLENKLAGAVTIIARALVADGARQAGWYSSQAFELVPGDNFCRMEVVRIDPHQVRGRVQMQNGRPAEAAQVRAWRTEGGDILALREGPLSTMTGADGRYMLLLTAPSNYVVGIESTVEYAQMCSSPVSRVLQLDPRIETKEVDFELSEGLTLGGHIERAGSKAEFGVKLAPLDQPGGWTEFNVAKDGSFRAGPFLPGHYRVMLTSGERVLDLVHAGPGTVKDIVLRAKP